MQIAWRMRQRGAEGPELWDRVDDNRDGDAGAGAGTKQTTTAWKLPGSKAIRSPSKFSSKNTAPRLVAMRAAKTTANFMFAGQGQWGKGR